MNFDIIENLDESEILQIYDDILDTSNLFLSGAIQKVYCSNGRTGYWVETGSNDPVGFRWSGSGNSTNAICGGYGSIENILVYSCTNGVIEEIRCNNGNYGYWLYCSYSSSTGTFYVCPGESTNAVCGYGRCGYATYKQRI